MTEVSSTEVEQNTENKTNNKEFNFRALERQLTQERAARLEAEKIAREAQEKLNSRHEEDDDSDPYVDHKKLEKKLSRFSQESKQQTQQEIQQAINQALSKERNDQWLRNNSDYDEVMTPENMDRFYRHDPELADAILKMPEGSERNKLVFKNIKALGLHKPPTKQPSIQEKIDANRQSPYYQPSGTGTAPYASVGDFSTQGQKQAYEQMQKLKSRYGM